MSLDTPPVGGVLCAGFGTRMAPITDAIPKPLIPFLNTPMLAYALDHLSAAGVTRVGMNLHHHADAIPPVADSLAATMNLDPVYAREWEILGTAGGIRGIWNALHEPDTTLIVFNGDSVMNIDLLSVLEAHRRSESAATLVVRPRDDEGTPGRVWVDEHSGQLMGLRDFRHPDAGDDAVEYTFTGVHLIEPEMAAEIPLEEGCIVGDVYGPWLENGGRINIETNTDFWAGIDSPGLLFEATRRVLDDPTIFDQVPMPEPLAKDLYVFGEQGIDDKTLMAGPVLSGAHVATESDTRIGPYAVLDGVEVSAGASVRNAVVYGMGRLEGKWHRCLAVAGKVANLPTLDDMERGAQPDDGVLVEEVSGAGEESSEKTSASDSPSDEASTADDDAW